MRTLDIIVIDRLAPGRIVASERKVVTDDALLGGEITAMSTRMGQAIAVYVCATVKPGRHTQLEWQVYVGEQF